MSENQDWSNHCADLLRPIIESLSTIDYHRAKKVCSDWYSVWKTCVKRPLYPWQFIYHDDSSSLFDPGEDKIYNTKLVGISDKSYYMASFGNCLLMVDSLLHFYIVNMLTCERINLPSMETSIRGGHVRFKRSGDEWGYFVDFYRKDRVSKDIFGSERSAVLWINERTGDYFVAWIFNKLELFTHKKGDDYWWNWYTRGANLGFLDLAYKNSKLYLYISDDHIKIVDFSGDCPKEEVEKNPYWDHPFDYVSKQWEYVWKTRIVIQKTGEVFIILSLLEKLLKETHLFYIFKMNFESNKWERVDSIGDDEMLIFGHGVTLRAPVQEVGDGIKSGSICFVEDDLFWLNISLPSNCGVFELATSRIKWFKRTQWKTQWFVVGFA
ncbi:unnamed protein product [Arabidopsis lyrata]|uniref:F-box domain-containing protein n=1 Tax=Arabidopsis lyrata subsp. lyrata TaxID=81972 RepID=D7M4G7_ARALL|nr:putative F-box protein At5g38270 [Arabidopsis lyrata subsp. lyrata]EFH49812.1 hypothetical protein ARALYDRAFT_909191 [Arabidopsis lyrata subsp. lyrata]CAH8270863.1 unnamed protein product [Arabidopsis lyrata]|eukprot:XP_002873553.1 putative F-box protein At5g38270 [Arabidopsis lyrata subsp. lyrata]